MQNLSPAQQELERIYKECNGLLFADKLPETIVITIQSRGRKQALAWYSPARWGKRTENTLPNHTETAAPEINFCAEALADGVEEILERMVHEMVHAQNAVKGIKDASKSGYHNKKFRTAAEDVGLVVKRGKKGHAYTSLSGALKEKLSEVNPQKDAFTLWRLSKQAMGSTGTKLRKWTCACRRNFWAKTDMTGVHCNTCLEDFQPQG